MLQIDTVPSVRFHNPPSSPYCVLVLYFSLPSSYAIMYRNPSFFCPEFSLAERRISVLLNAICRTLAPKVIGRNVNGLG